MKLHQGIFDPISEKLFMGTCPEDLLAAAVALSLNVKVNSVDGTAIAGALSGSDKVFTRSDSYYFVDNQIVKFSDIVATETEDNFRVGEEVQDSGGAVGTITQVFDSYIVVDTVNTALFTADTTLTGQSSTVTATVTEVETTVTDLTNTWVWAHVSGSTEVGALERITANTATTLTTGNAMPSDTTAVILFDSKGDAVRAMDIVQDKQSPTMAGTLVTETGTLTGAEGVRTMIAILTSAANIAVTLPDVYTVPDEQEYCFVGIDVETKAFTVVSPSAAQKLDGVDISATGTPLATIDANGDYLIIGKNAAGTGWETIQSGIQA